MVNKQFDKMSRLEFVAIQFCVKFTVTYKLRYYVDKDCQLYLHYFALFPKLYYSMQLFHYFMIISLFYHFISFLYFFQGHIFLFLIRIYGLGSPFYEWNRIHKI